MCFANSFEQSEHRVKHYLLCHVCCMLFPYPIFPHHTPGWALRLNFKTSDFEPGAKVDVVESTSTLVAQSCLH